MHNRVKGCGSHMSFMCFSPKQKECKREQWSNRSKGIGEECGKFVWQPVLTLTVITPFRPTFFIASEIILPISWSPFADIVATWKSKTFNLISQCKVFSHNKNIRMTICNAHISDKAGQLTAAHSQQEPGTLLEGLRLLGSCSTEPDSLHWAHTQAISRHRDK